MRKAAQRLTSPAGATVIYDTPHVIKEHNDQSAISTQDNVAYGGTIPLKQNEAYEQVQHIDRWTINNELIAIYDYSSHHSL